MRIGTTSLVLCLLAGAAPARAADALDAALTTCWSCHGEAGTPKDPTIPIIWGQHAAYLEKQLRDYRSGDRDNQIMSSMAEAVPRNDIARAAALIAGKAWPKRGSGAVAAPPETLATCIACHGEGLTGGQSPEGPAPRLAGQFPDYLADQMSAFARGERTNQKTMSAMMKALSEAERKTLAAYLGAL